MLALQDLATNRLLGSMLETINFPRRISKEKTWKQTGITNRPELRVMLYRTISNDDFLRNTAIQHCCDIRAIYTTKNKSRLT